MEKVLLDFNKRLDLYIKHSKKREIKKIMKEIDGMVLQFIGANITENEGRM